MKAATLPGSVTVTARAAKAISYGMSAEHNTMLSAVLQGEISNKCYFKPSWLRQGENAYSTSWRCIHGRLGGVLLKKSLY